MAKTRRKHTGPPWCHDCRLPVVFFRSPFTGQLRTFNPKPVDMRQQLAGAYPVYAGRAWKLADLVEEPMVIRRCSHEEARAEATDLPWHTLHACPGREPAGEFGGDR